MRNSSLHSSRTIKVLSMPRISLVRVVLFVSCMLSLFASNAAYSQDERSNRDLARLIDDQLHEFFDRKGMIIGVGRVADISNKQVLYVDGVDKKHIHDIRDLSKSDQAYCRDLLKQLGAIEQSRKSAKKIEKQLLSSKTKSQIRACIQLRELGMPPRNRFRCFMISRSIPSTLNLCTKR